MAETSTPTTGSSNLGERLGKAYDLLKSGEFGKAYDALFSSQTATHPAGAKPEASNLAAGGVPAPSTTAQETKKSWFGRFIEHPLDTAKETAKDTTDFLGGLIDGEKGGMGMLAGIAMLVIGLLIAVFSGGSGLMTALGGVLGLAGAGIMGAAHGHDKKEGPAPAAEASPPAKDAVEERTRERRREQMIAAANEAGVKRNPGLTGGTSGPAVSPPPPPPPPTVDPNAPLTVVATHGR